jgi:hypothetical protein
MAGRIDAVDEQGVHIHVAQPPADGVPAKAKHGYVTITAADFDRWSLDDKLHQMSAGRFLELAWYGDDPDPAIRAHRAGEWQDRDLPPLFPDPARYLREAGWVEQRP